MRASVFLFFFGLPSLIFAQSTSVYLTPHSPSPTGHFDLTSLEKRRVSQDQFEWLWVKDKSGQQGWILKSSALLPLDFSRQAILPKGEAVYPKPRAFALPQKTLEKSQIVNLVKRHRDWYKIIYKEKKQKFYGWVRSRYLSPYSKDAGYLFSTKETQLYQAPQFKSKILTAIDPGYPLIPLNTKGDWAYVKFNNFKGYIPFHNIKSRLDVAMKVRTPKGYFKPHPSLYKEKVLEIFATPLWAGSGAYSLDLKAQPSMGSRTIAQVKPWQDLTVQGYSIKKWSKSFVPKWGELWWPETTIESNVEIIENLTAESIRLRASEVYQVERSPVIQGLRFASTPRGIFRSFDGRNWHPLKDFKGAYPMKMAPNGSLFIGDKVSFDHGESFQHFIRWDLVFKSLPNKRKLQRGPIQILNVEPHKNHNQVTLSLKVGRSNYLQLYTPDFGKNWRLR